jgi:hypothetical protein
MTLVAIEGFDTFGTTEGDAGSADVVAGLQAKYTGEFEQGNDTRIYAGWGSGKALSFGRDTTADNNYALIPVGTPKATIVTGFAFRPRGNPHVAQHFMSFYDVSEDKEHVACQCLLGNTLRVKLGTFGIVLLGNVYDAFRPERWTYVEIKVTIDNTVGAVEVKINGIQRLNLTGIDTNNGATVPQITHVKLIGGEGNADSIDGSYMFDDVYVANTDGATNNDFLGPIKIESLFPDAEGDNVDFLPSAGTDNALNVDENPSDGDTTYNESGTFGHYDLLTASNLSTITGNIKGIQLNTDARVTDATPIDLINKVKTGVTEDEAAAQGVSDETNFTTFSDIWEEDPDTATDWTVSGVNGIQIGYEVG